MVSRTLKLAVGLWLGLGVQAARAEIQVPGATVAVINPADHATCVAESILRNRILDQMPSTAPSANTVRRIDVVIANEPAGLSAELRVVGSSAGVRQIEATQCAGLVEALAFTIVMILDREASRAPALPAEDAKGPKVAAKGPKAADLRAASPRAREVKRVTSAKVYRAASTKATPTKAASSNGATSNEASSNAKSNEASSNDASSNATTLAQAADARRSTSRGLQLPENEELRAGAGVGVGTWTRLQIETGVSFFLNDWGMGLGAFLQPTEERDLGGGHLKLMTVGGTAEACRRFGRDWRVLFCLRGLLGGQRVQGTGYAEGVPNEMVMVGAVGPTLGLETGSAWVFGVHVMGLADLWRDRFFVDNESASLKKPFATAWLVARVALSSAGSSQPRTATGVGLEID